MAIVFSVLRLSIFLFFLLLSIASSAQAWLPGYGFRKTITVDKSKVESSFFLKHLNFVMLVEVEDEALIYQEDVFDQKLKNSLGRDISFADVTTPNVALKFQLESYDPVKGKMRCWVILPVLWSRGSSNVTQLYLYYGGTILHDPDHPDVKNMWQADYHAFLNFNEGSPGVIKSAKAFNGTSDYMDLAMYAGDDFYFSVWFKLNNLGKEQMLITNDSLGFGGAQIKINSDNRLMMLIPSPTHKKPFVGMTIIKANEWYHVGISVKNGLVAFYMNGKSESGVAGSNYTIASPGKLRIGASKQNDRYFDGTLDELSFRKTGQTKESIITSYENQRNPTSFFTIGAEVVNPNVTPISEFHGHQNELWRRLGNWSPSALPGKDSDVKIKAGITAELIGDIELRKLLLEKGAKLILNGNLKVSELLMVEQGASIVADGAGELQMPGYVLNNGAMLLAGSSAKLLISGDRSLTRYSGNGTAVTSLLEVNQQAPGAVINLQALLQVKTSVKVVKGTLVSNGNLWLLADSLNTAAIYPLSADANISGHVHVQNFVGTFQAPATGRGWRLLSAPVLYGPLAGDDVSPFQDLKKSIFVTGATGNGFDESPRNGATIYTHNESLPGTLAQKYVAISNIQMPMPIGKGFFVYSRGNRWLPGAYQHQVQGAPFLNASSYVITYSGVLHKGDLQVDVFNTQKGDQGDGFNLVGNPYAAPIRWGSITKINIGPHVWLFDPLNNTYRVSMDDEEIIPAGAGFFIKVDSNSSTGKIIFTEGSKVLPL